jgi:predicted metal-dependent phosphotriesterase family hydrolase
MGSVTTVCGKISGEDMGYTLSHEHLIVSPNLPDKKYDDYRLTDVELMCREVEKFKEKSGRTIVEMTPLNYGRDPLKYKEISLRENINIICCTGYHKEEFLDRQVFSLSETEITDILLKEINDGIGDTGVYPGVLKCGTSYNNITETERKIIKAAAKVHELTGIPISTHCDKGTMMLEQGELLKKYGVSPENILLGHTDIQEDVNVQLEVLKRGFNILTDHVGRELDNTDENRIRRLEIMIKSGFANQLFLSGDMGKKDYISTYGGKPGLDYILGLFKEKFVKEIGGEYFDKITKDNPKRFFSY